jgi:hypothetical protein
MFFSPRTVIAFGFFLRLLVAIWNGFWGPSLGASGDSIGGHLTAVEFPDTLILSLSNGAFNYVYLLGRVYDLTIHSLFWGCLISCFVWTASAGLLLKIMNLLSIARPHQSKAMLVYSLLPSSIFLTAITLREPYQLLLVNLAVYAALKIFLNRSFLHWLVLIFAISGISLSHHALFTFGVTIAITTLIMLSRRAYKGFCFVKLFFIAPVIGLIAFLAISQFTDFAMNAGNKSGKLVKAVERFRNNASAFEARAQYSDKIQLNSMEDLLLYSPKIFSYYLFEPMPWRSLSSVDYVAIMENIVRTWLICLALIGLWKLPAQNISPVMFVFINYFILELIWSMGTVNWGTALRHHIPSFGLLVIAAFAYSGRKRIRIRPELQNAPNVT